MTELIAHQRLQRGDLAESSGKFGCRSCPYFAHCFPIYLCHITTVIFLVIFKELFKIGQLYRIVDRTVQDAVVAFLASILVFHREFLSRFVSMYLYTGMFASNYTGLTSVAVFYNLRQLHFISSFALSEYHYNKYLQEIKVSENFKNVIAFCVRLHYNKTNKRKYIIFR